MDLNDNGSKTISLSVSNQMTEGGTENRLPYNESLSCESRPQIQLRKLEEKIQTSKSNYNTIETRLKFMKCPHHGKIHSQNDCGNSQRSASSSDSLKITTSEHSIEKEEEENHQIYCKDKIEKLMNVNRTENHLQIDLTPRSQKNENEIPGGLVPHLNIRTGESQESIKTNKRIKKLHKLKKKSQGNRTNDNIIKTSTILTAKSEIKSMRKKFHGRLKNSNSKSTVVTRDTIFSGKKADRKKFKTQKSN